jgi:hypothetical protein
MLFFLKYTGELHIIVLTIKTSFTCVKVEKGTKQKVKEHTFMAKRLSPERERQLETAN